MIEKWLNMVKNYGKMFRGRNGEKPQLVFMHVEREIVEKGSTFEVGKFIKSAEKSGMVYDFFQTLTITFNGYDDDVRELYEIKEVRDWTRKVINTYPQLFYYLNCTFEAHLILLKNYFDLETAYYGKRKTLWEHIKDNAIPQYNIQLNPNPQELHTIITKTVQYANKHKNPLGGRFVLFELMKVFGVDWDEIMNELGEN
jgi:hypothetical protein